PDPQTNSVRSGPVPKRTRFVPAPTPNEPFVLAPTPNQPNSGAGEVGGAAFEEGRDAFAVVVALEARRERGGVAFHVLADRRGQAVVHERLDQSEAVRGPGH